MARYLIMSASVPPASPYSSRQRKKPVHVLWKLLFSMLFGLLLLEIGLRLQQKLGPWFDLNMAEIHPGIVSEELNHRPEHLATWPYDENGIIQYSFDRIPKAAQEDRRAWRMLFMGDSFMQGYGKEAEIPWQIWSRYRDAGIPMIPFNAGYYSYSPSIFVVQARKILPVVKPDMVVVVIDNTDMGDDAFRYRNLVERDEQGKIVRVRSTPGYAFFIQGFLDAKQHWLYTSRLVHKLYHTRFAYPKMDAGKTNRISDQVCESISDQSENVNEKYRDAVLLFENNLRELADVLIQQVGTAQRLLWVCHPNPFHLQATKEKPAPNQLVFHAVEKIAREKNLHYYNATDDLRKVLGNNYEQYYLKGDPVYHFNQQGVPLYAKQIFEHLPADWKVQKKE